MGFMSEDVKARVLKYLLEASDTDMEAEKVKPEMSLRDDLDFNSLVALEVVMDLEDEFNVSLSDQEVASLQTVGDIYKLIEEKYQG